MADPRRFSPESEAPYDASDEKQVKAAQEASKRREQERREIEAAILASPQGREWLYQILKDCHSFEQRFPMSGNLFEAGFFAGERDVGIRLMNHFAAASPEHYGRMIKENSGG